MTRTAVTVASIALVGISLAGATASGLLFASTDQTITPQVTGYAPVGNGHVIQCGDYTVCWSTDSK